LKNMAGDDRNSRNDDFSSEHTNPDAIYHFMNRAENMLDRIEKYKSVGCFYNLLSEAYNSMLACCVLWYTKKFGAQAEQKYLGDFVSIVEGCIEGAPELDKILAKQGNPKTEPGEREALEGLYSEYKTRLLDAVGKRASDLMIRLEEDKAGRYTTFYEKLNSLCKAFESGVNSIEQQGGESPSASTLD